MNSLWNSGWLVDGIALYSEGIADIGEGNTSIDDGIKRGNQAGEGIFYRIE